MDFELGEDQRAIVETAQAFAAAELAPHAARWDEDKHFPVEDPARGGGAGVRRHMRA